MTLTTIIFFPRPGEFDRNLTFGRQSGRLLWNRFQGAIQGPLNFGRHLAYRARSYNVGFLRLVWFIALTHTPE